VDCACGGLDFGSWEITANYDGSENVTTLEISCEQGTADVAVFGSAVTECGDNLVPGVEARLVGAGESNGCAGSVEGEQDGEVIPLSCVPDPDAMQDCICRGLGQGDWSVTATFGDATETVDVSVALDSCNKPVTQQLTFFE
jgi:hypothetical protein